MNKLTQFILASIVILIIALTASFIMSDEMPETFEAGSVASTEQDKKVVMNPPSANDNPVELILPKTGTIMDGPGFERTTSDSIQGMVPTLPNKIPNNYYFLDDGADGEMSIQHNLCSKSCCSPQYPVPFAMDADPYVCNNKDKLVASNIMCNNSFQDSGCACLTTDQARFLYNRGTNGREWF